MEPKKTSFPAIRRLCGTAIAILVSFTAHGAIIVWDGSNDGFWGKGNNWQGQVPTAADDVVFDHTADRFTVNLGSESRAAQSLTIDSATAYTVENQMDTPTFTLTVGDVTVSSGTGHVIYPPVVLANDATYSIATGTDLTLEESMTGTHTLTKTGDGRLILGRFSPSAGDTIIDAGSIRIDNQSALRYRSVTLNVDGGLETNGHLAYLGSLAGSGNFDTNDAGVTVGFDDTSTTYSGTLTSIDTGSLNESIEKIGDGTWTLTGTDYNIETGFYVSDGQVVFDGVDGYIWEISSSSGTDITFSGGASLIMEEATINRFIATDASTVVIIDALQSSGELIVEHDARLNVGSQFRLNGGSLVVDGGKVNLSGTLVNDTPGSIQLSDPSGGTALTFDLGTDQAFDDVISDYTNGSGSIFKKGDGDLTLSGANTHSGNTTISDGRIVLGNPLALQNSTVIIGSDHALDLNGHDAMLGGLAGSGALELGANTLTVGGNDSSTHYNGVLSGVGGLVKEGAGTLSLSGSHSFTGDTAINEGAIFLLPDADDINTSLQNTTVSINVANGLQNDAETYEIYIGALEGSGDYDANGAYVVVGGNNASTTYSGNLTDDFLALRKEGTGIWTLTGSNLLISHFQIPDGAVVFDGAGANMTVFSSAYQPITFQNGTEANVINLSGSNITVDQSSLTVRQITAFSLDDILAISDPVGGTALTIDSTLNRDVKSTIIDYTSGPGSLMKLGEGTFILSGENTYSGNTTISDGRIVLGNALALQNSTVIIESDHALDLNGHDALLGGLTGSGALALDSNTITVGGNDASTHYNGVLSGTGGLIKEGNGTLSLSGSNLFTGDIDINGGTINLVPDDDGYNYAVQNNTIHLNVDHGLQHDSVHILAIGGLTGNGDYDAKSGLVEVGGNNANTSYSGNITGTSATILKEGAGTWTLQGNDLAIPNLLVGSGAVNFDGAVGSVNVISTVNRPVRFQNGADITTGFLSSQFITIESNAVLTVNGDYAQNHGDILTRTVGDTSNLHVTGTATWDGTIQVLFPDGFTPPVGKPLPLCTFGSMDEGNPTLDTSALPAGYAYTLEVISDGATSALALGVNYADTADGCRLQYGLATDGSEDELDESGNGITNLLYFAFGLGDPAEANIDHRRLPAISDAPNTGNLVITYVRPTANDSGLEIYVVTSVNMVDWFTPDELGLHYLPVSETTEPLGDDHIIVTEIYAIQIDEDGRFYRVSVETFDGQSGDQ